MPLNKLKPSIIIIHGGNSYFSQAEYLADLERFEPRFRDGYVDWKAHIILELSSLYQVLAPQMPSKDNAKYAEWKLVFEKVLKMEQVTPDIILIGHSLGANFLQKYLGETSLTDFNKNLVELHLVSGCLSEGDFVETQDWSSISNQTKQIYIWHSEDDRVVSVAEAHEYQSKLRGSKLHLFQDKGHMNQEYFPELVGHLVNLATTHQSTSHMAS